VRAGGVAREDERHVLGDVDGAGDVGIGAGAAEERDAPHASYEQRPGGLVVGEQEHGALRAVEVVAA